MVETSDLLSHWAEAEAFVLAHMGGPQTLKPQMLLDEVRKHDRAIRAAWAAKFRDNTVMTYFEVINIIESLMYADNAWKTSYATHLEFTALADRATGHAYSKSRGGSPARKGDKGGGRRRRTNQSGRDNPETPDRRERRDDSRSRTEKGVDNRRGDRRGRSRGRRGGDRDDRGRRSRTPAWPDHNGTV